MKSLAVALLCLTAVFAVYCSAESEISAATAIAIATEDMKHTALSVNNVSVSAHKWSTPENDVINTERASGWPYAQRILAKLKRRTYWLVAFRPVKPQLGGGAAVFIDAATGEILGSVGSR